VPNLHPINLILGPKQSHGNNANKGDEIRQMQILNKIDVVGDKCRGRSNKQEKH
jgi:hypothetical protein